MSFMSNLLIAFFGYIIDRIFGEFTFMKHPVSMMGDLITFSEKKLYKDSVLSGALLVVIVLGVIGVIAVVLDLYLGYFNTFIQIIISSFIASIFIAHKMLKDSIKEILYLETLEKKREAVAMLVSRDTKDLSESEINKAAIETYAENLSDGVVAPIFYLLCFGLPGIIIYKAINTMDSMIAYKNKRYEKFGKVAARLDDIANLIPSRITALLITLVYRKKFTRDYVKDARGHESPNAGHPISAMAYSLGVKLGGDTSYFGEIKHKPHFGFGDELITQNHLRKMLY